MLSLNSGTAPWNLVVGVEWCEPWPWLPQPPLLQPPPLPCPLPPCPCHPLPGCNLFSLMASDMGRYKIKTPHNHSKRCRCTMLLQLVQTSLTQDVTECTGGPIRVFIGLWVLNLLQMIHWLPSNPLGSWQYSHTYIFYRGLCRYYPLHTVSWNNVAPRM